MLKYVFKYAAINLASSFVDNVFKPVVSPKIGSVVYCELAFGLGDHSGIYVGNGEIVHLNGDGLIEIVSPSVFLNRLNGFNTAISIYVSCRSDCPAGLSSVARRARSMVGSERNYSFIFDNCHQFSSGCLTGDFENSCNFMWMLKDDARKIISANNWLVWERIGEDYVY